MSDIIKIYVDGGCKRNGGDNSEAYGSMAVEYQGKIQREVHQDFPNASTNNEAEYCAVLMAMSYIDGLKRRAAIVLSKIEILTDSQLIYGQLCKGYKVKAENLRGLFRAAMDWLLGNPDVVIEKVDRDLIKAVLGH